MKISRPLVFGLFLIVALIFVVGLIEATRRYSSVSSPNTDISTTRPFPRELKDVNGETLVIKEKPNRIVSQTLATDEILLAICEPQRIAALSSLADDVQYSDITAEAKAVQGRVSGGAEQVLAMKPDLVFVASYSKAEFVDLLKAAKAPVFRFANFDHLSDIKTNIQTIGYAVGEDEKATNLIKKFESELEEIKAKVPKTEKTLRVMSYDKSGFTAGTETMFDEILTLLGAKNVTAEKGLKGFPKISTEQLIEWNPDVIITGADGTKIEETRRELLADDAVKTTNAGKNQRIIVIPNNIFLAVTHHVTKSIRQIETELYK